MFEKLFQEHLSTLFKFNDILTYGQFLRKWRLLRIGPISYLLYAKGTYSLLLSYY